MSYAANIAGTEFSGWAAMLENKAMRGAYQAELARQAAFRQQALDEFNQQLGGKTADTANQQLGAALNQREQNYQNITGIPMSVTRTGLGVGPREQAYSRLRGEQRGKLGAYSDWRVNQKIADEQTGRILDQITNFAKGTSNVFPYRMYAAQHSHDDLAAVGAALSSIGGGGFQSPYGGPPAGIGAGAGYGAGAGDYYGSLGVGDTGALSGGYYGAGFAQPAGMPSQGFDFSSLGVGAAY